MRKLILIILIAACLPILFFNRCISESDKIDYYVADTTLRVWSIKFNKGISEFIDNDTIILGTDSLLTWSVKVNRFINLSTSDSIIYGIDNFEAWRTKFNTAIDSIFNPAAIQLFDRFSEEPPGFLKNSISQWYDTVQYYNIDDTLDVRYVFSLHNSTDALIDWFRDTTATLINSPTFTQYEGFTGNGTTQYIKANYNPAVDGVNFLLNSASLTARISTNIIENRAFAYVYDGTDYLRIVPRTTGNFQTSINTNTGPLFAHNDDVGGYTIITRTDAGNYSYARNGNAYSSAASSSTNIPNESDGLYIMGGNVNGTPGVLSTNTHNIINIGGQLTDLQQQKLYEADERYINAIIRKREIVLFTFDGQSNMTGDGQARYDSVSTDSTDAVNNCLIYQEGQTLVPIDASVGHARWPDGTLYFGPNMNFANKLEPNRYIKNYVFAMYAVGGTYLCPQGGDDWNINSTGELWDKYNNVIDSTIYLATQADYSINKMVRVVFQGESDCLDESCADNYYDNQIDLIEDYNSKYAAYNPIHIFYKIKTGYGTYNSTVRTAFDNLEARDDVWIINIDDITTDRGVHLTPQGYLDCGTRLYQYASDTLNLVD